MSKNLGFTVPFILIFISVFASVPVLFWFVKSNNVSDGSIQGVTTQAEDVFEGVRVKITSGSGTWDISTYVCDTLDECKSHLNSGRRVNVVSGGKVNDYIVDFKRSNDWEGKKYLKIFAKTGWGEGASQFDITNLNFIQDTVIEEIESSNTRYSVAIVPIENLPTNVSAALEFSLK